MNKSLVFRNKFYKFIFLFLSFFTFIYLINVLISGEKGLFSYYSNLSVNYQLISELNNKIDKNRSIEDKIKRLSPNTLDLDFLDEKLRHITGRSLENELVVIIKK